MTDPDLLAIQRRRLGAHRCVRCGSACGGRRTICATCAAVWCYCPCCETVYARRPGRRSGGPSEYCLSCRNAARGITRNRAEYEAARRERTHRLLPEVIRLYKQGLTYDAIAQALGVKTVRGLVWKAKQKGQWPAKLRRKGSQASQEGPQATKGGEQW